MQRSLLAMILCASVAAGAQTDSLEARLRLSLQAPLVASTSEIWSEVASAEGYFYALRDFQPAWVDAQKPAPVAQSMLEILARTPTEGMAAERYRTSFLLGEWAQLATAEFEASTARLEGFERALTQSALRYTQDAMEGRVDPRALYSDWDVQRGSDSAPQRLSDALHSIDPVSEFQRLQPSHPGYLWLREAFVRYRAIAQESGWSSVPPGSVLETGARDTRVPLIREHLAKLGDLVGSIEPRSLDFDAETKRAVTQFQVRHGLAATGQFNESTRQALNISPDVRAQQMALNLERWRWLPASFGDRYIVVNAADYHLSLVVNGRVLFESPVIVGKDYRRTPVFSARMSHLVLNPSWNVPPRIAVEDKLPLIRNDPDYLQAHDFQLLEGWGANERKVDPRTVDWSKIQAGNFPYHLRQSPGRQNALGRVKFMFPNRFNVYLHDTPQRELFQRSKRSFSSGCIRVARPLELAAHILGGVPGWGELERLDQTLSRGQLQTVSLPSPVPVHLLYWTAWVEADGTVHFREDIYGRDAVLASAL
jgi:murein L,D-transpeptidase YcbB/YkuD